MVTDLKTLYTSLDHPTAFGSIKALYTAAKKQNPGLKLQDVKKWLISQDSYNLHKQAIGKFRRNRIRVSFIDEQWELDLVSLENLSNMNQGYKYILMCIDVFSKFVWAQPLKSKDATSICTAFKKVLNLGRQPYKVRTDKGGEFVNTKFKNLLKIHDIQFFTSQNEDIKCSIVERVNRTIKGKMWRYFTHFSTFKWIDILNKLIHNYNHSYHRSIKEKPVNVKHDNQYQIWKTLYPVKAQGISILNIGDHVRISKFRQKFDKGYIPRWTEEIFIIDNIIKRPVVVYTIKDLQGEKIEGTFYKEELQKVLLEKDKIYKIENIIKKRTLKGGRVQYLVKWFGYPEKFNEWVDRTDLE